MPLSGSLGSGGLVPGMVATARLRRFCRRRPAAPGRCRPGTRCRLPAGLKSYTRCPGRCNRPLARPGSARKVERLIPHGHIGQVNGAGIFDLHKISDRVARPGKGQVGCFGHLNTAPVHRARGQAPVFVGIHRHLYLVAWRLLVRINGLSGSTPLPGLFGSSGLVPGMVATARLVMVLPASACRAVYW